MIFDDAAFLHSLATWAAPLAHTSLGLPVTYGVNLFTNRAAENTAADPYAVLRTYGGTGERTNPKPTALVQGAVAGSSVVSARRMATALFESIVFDGYGRENRQVTIPGFDPVTNAATGSWTIVAAQTINRPGQLGQDERGLVRVVFNVQIGFFYTPPA